MHDEANAEDTVEERRTAAAGDEGSSGEGNEAGREKALKRPVVRAVNLGGWRECGWVVRAALDDSCKS